MKKFICIVSNTIFSIIIFSIFLTAKPYMYSNIFSFLAIFLSILILVISGIMIKSDKIMLIKILFILNFICTIILLIYHLLKINNVLYIFKSVENFKLFILSTGNLGIFIYILIQMIQVIFLPIPASIIAIAGALVYGPFMGALYCTIGVLLGSYISFFLGRTVGYKLVCWAVGKENADKYSGILSNGKMFLAVAFLLPMFPDDILCLIAGLTNMGFKYFLIITTIFRPIGVICMCYFGGGYIIPFSGWGIPVWIILGILIAILVISIYKNQTIIEEWVVKKLSKRNKAKLKNKKTLI